LPALDDVAAQESPAALRTCRPKPAALSKLDDHSATLSGDAKLPQG
jgi:hypothetical protein